MTQVIVITGTDTEVGKTVTTAAIAAMARQQGLAVAVVKPVQTGVEAGAPGDLKEVRRLSGTEDLHELARLPEPLAPGTAARRAGIELPAVSQMSQAIAGLSGRDLILVEGAGGLMVELDSQGGTIADLAADLAVPVLVVARAGLGTLNHVGLTCGALRSRGLECPGVIIGSWPAEPDLAAQCNMEDLPRYSGVPLLGRLPEGAGRLDRMAFVEAADEWLDRSLLGFLPGKAVPVHGAGPPA